MGEGGPLTGGSDTAGIVRIGDTVRRPLRPFSLTVQAYLARLREAGFTGAPLPLGVDEQGREVLSFVPGEVYRHPLPTQAAGEDVLVALARLIRALHEASAGWVPPPGAVWGGTPASTGRITERAELVSHRDYATGNVVFRGGLPAALIDFDLARPTTRLYDIANALWFWAPLKWGDPRDRAPALADADIPHRVAVFADAYGMTARQRAELAPLAVGIARRYHEDSRALAKLDPVLQRAEAWVRGTAPAIAARLSQPGKPRAAGRPLLTGGPLADGVLVNFQELGVMAVQGQFQARWPGGGQLVRRLEVQDGPAAAGGVFVRVVPAAVGYEPARPGEGLPHLGHLGPRPGSLQREVRFVVTGPLVPGEGRVGPGCQEQLEVAPGGPGYCGVGDPDFRSGRQAAAPGQPLAYHHAGQKGPWREAEAGQFGDGGCQCGRKDQQPGMDERAGAGDGCVLGGVQPRREHGEQRCGVLGADEAGELPDPEAVRLIQRLA
jgi:hypothetical protein